jgi:hypothetical protein
MSRTGRHFIPDKTPMARREAPTCALCAPFLGL